MPATQRIELPPPRQVSEHQVRLYLIFKERRDWLTSKEAAGLADIADRTARHHCKSLAESGVFEVQPVFGGYRYRLSQHIDPQSRARIGDLEAARDVMRI